MAGAQGSPGRGGPPRKAARALVIHPADNVATVVSAGVSTGSVVRLSGGAARGTVTVRGTIPYGHKVALSPIPAGADVIKYGLPIGRTTRPIRAGDHVHVHNVESRRGRGDLARRGPRRAP
jgi:altronate dehydratase small subunit